MSENPRDERERTQNRFSPGGPDRAWIGVGFTTSGFSREECQHISKQVIINLLFIKLRTDYSSFKRGILLFVSEFIRPMDSFLLPNLLFAPCRDTSFTVQLIRTVVRSWSFPIRDCLPFTHH